MFGSGVTTPEPTRCKQTPPHFSNTLSEGNLNMVKILVATTEAQGDRPTDYACAVDGELVYVPVNGCRRPSGRDVGLWCVFEAAGRRVDDELGCSCARGFVGMASNRPSTTALVVERLDLSIDNLLTALGDSLDRQGRAEDSLEVLFKRMLATASHFPIGSIIERQGDRIRRRAMAEPLSVPSDLIGGDG